MEITKEYLYEQLAQREAALTQCKADMDANAGAIQQLKQLIQVLDTPAPVTQPKK